MADAGYTHAAGADILHSAISRRGKPPALAGLVVGLAYAAIIVYWAVGGRWLLNTAGISRASRGRPGTWRRCSRCGERPQSRPSLLSCRCSR